MNRILITTSSFGGEDDTSIHFIQNAGYEVIRNPFGRKLTEEEALLLLGDVKPVGMIAGVEPLTARVLGAAPNLRVISRCGIGLDSVDLVAARAKGIIVTNTPDAPSRAVAELTIGLILGALRHFVVADKAIRKGEWKRPMGRLLGKQVMGIVGCGRIGSAVAELLKPFGSVLLGYDPYIKKHHLVSLMPLDDLLGQADVVTLHIPYSPSVHHLFNDQLIRKMKPRAIIVNTSRGGIVDETALCSALVSGHLAGACLDTFEEEPYYGPLSELGQVVLSPHIGSYARETRADMEKEAVVNLLRALENTN